jgi:hypothetical protein
MHRLRAKSIDLSEREQRRGFMSEVIATLAGILEDLPDNDDYTAEDVALDMAEALVTLLAAGTPEEDIQHDIKQFASEFKSGAYGHPEWRMVDWASLLTDPRRADMARKNYQKIVEGRR